MQRPNPWYRFVAWFFRYIIYGSLGGVRVLNADRVPHTGPILIAPIHFSTADPPLMGAACPRPLRFMAKKELFFFPLKYFIRSVGAFPVSRGEGDTAAVRLTLEQLKLGNGVLIFPEGTRGDGKTLGSIQLGLAMIAKKSGALIVPVGINGTQQMLPKGQAIPKRTKLIVSFGHPFSYEEIAVSSNERENRSLFVQELTKRLLAAAEETGLHLSPPRIDAES
ncbi:1-acyl-sn-glycerol-3-phosphate acyltransferase [bacterium]|nr:1-acyl-sn-glycerol-3-phosphate acyltransferase [bacterium]